MNKIRISLVVAVAALAVAVGNSLAGPAVGTQASGHDHARA